AGQLALSNQTKLLEKLIDRFSIAVQLSDTDVEAVTRKVLLQKQPAAAGAVKEMLEANAGEISRQLQGTKIAARPGDRAVLFEDYPLLPARRRFWEQCFRQIDTGGTESQLRSQLRIIHDALRKIAGAPLGTLIAASELYDALAPGLVTVGVLPREIADRIIALGKPGDADARLRQQICGLAFLIGELRQNPGSPADRGVCASREHMADLLVEDFNADNAKLRERVAKMLEELAEQGVLMRVDSEYRIQTDEGRAWEQDFRNREHGFRGDLANTDEQRESLLGAEVDRLVRETKLLQGAAKVPRWLEAFRSADPPVPDGVSIPVWVRDQFSVAEGEVREAARRLGNESPVLTVFLPRKSPDDLRSAIAAYQAADQTISAHGIPATDAGKLARRAMESRRELAKQRRDALIVEMVAAGVVLQAGGNALLPLTIDGKLRAGAEAAMARLFPRFKEADYPAAAWEGVLKRARDGADHPFAPLKFDGAAEQHPVCQQARTAV
ncbi:MAG: BREX system P-loop protein BrxC, partial [Stellaceae bacterium]